MFYRSFKKFRYRRQSLAGNGKKVVGHCFGTVEGNVGGKLAPG